MAKPELKARVAPDFMRRFRVALAQSGETMQGVLVQAAERFLEEVAGGREKIPPAALQSQSKGTSGENAEDHAMLRDILTSGDKHVADAVRANLRQFKRLLSANSDLQTAKERLDRLEQRTEGDQGATDARGKRPPSKRAS